uniref:Uncharacterized protein n=1 Tax=Arundo donax TaxID=35708 RepID=A0A0A9DXB3_ARUDO
MSCIRVQGPWLQITIW